MFFAALALAAAISTPIPHDAARRAFDDARIASEEDGGRLWGKALYGPMLLVDPATRYAVANVADAEGVLKAEGTLFVGTLPPSVVIANTATNWNGVHWTMMMWGSIAERSVPRRRLMLHECFHRIQDEVGFPAGANDNAHLDSLDGRFWFLLELRALAAALRSDDRKQAVADALAFRVKRRALFPSATSNERSLENNEGLAEYTGVVLRGTGDEETRLSTARRLDAIDRGSSFVRSFAYSSGPAYGLLLDVANPNWRKTYKIGSDFGDTLRESLKPLPPSDPDVRAAAYNGATLRAEEEKRDRAQREKVAKFRALLVDGPTIEIPMEGAQFGFDPYTVVPLGDAGTAYPSLDVTGPWGRIAAANGARIDAGFTKLVFSISDRANLTLNEGFSLQPGVRKGDLVLARAKR
ncbi:MAG: hypothetical protein QOC81_1054 [Thermoanaerobaculia bacterium]|jgi:hypothetical protein|nr:hypothetical protein [Thermoanaerobaculia bacterium]